MSSTKLITMYGSLWSERVRWALAFTTVPYEKENYEPNVDEEKIKKLTGQAMVPVLLADGNVIPESTAILEWLEESTPGETVPSQNLIHTNSLVVLVSRRKSARSLVTSGSQARCAFRLRHSCRLLPQDRQ